VQGLAIAWGTSEVRLVCLHDPAWGTQGGTKAVAGGAWSSARRPPGYEPAGYRRGKLICVQKRLDLPLVLHSSATLLPSAEASAWAMSFAGQALSPCA